MTGPEARVRHYCSQPIRALLSWPRPRLKIFGHFLLWSISVKTFCVWQSLLPKDQLKLFQKNSCIFIPKPVDRGDVPGHEGIPQEVHEQQPGLQGDHGEVKAHPEFKFIFLRICLRFERSCFLLSLAQDSTCAGASDFSRSTNKTLKSFSSSNPSLFTGSSDSNWLD